MRWTTPLRGQLATAFDDAGVGSAASRWQEAFEEFSVGCLDRTGESAGGKRRLVDDLAAHDAQ
jgi:hypothetical protein